MAPASGTRSARAAAARHHAEVLAQIDQALKSRAESLTLVADGHDVSLTNLTKKYFPNGGRAAQTKGDMLRYYVRVAPALLTHFRERPVVLTRYPDGAGTKGFYVQRAPEQRPAWVQTCTTSVKPPKVMSYLRIESTAALAWIANLGAIEMHPWYARCSAPTQPDYLVIDLDPVPGVGFAKVRTAALVVKEALDAWKLPAFVKTSGASGLHLYVPIARGPLQREVHATARDVCLAVASRHPRLFTTEYRIANRPNGRVLLDFNQNAPGHTLAGPYSVRPTAYATVSTPVAWDDIANGIVPRDLTIATVPTRLADDGDPWASSKLDSARVDLMKWRDAMLSVPTRGRRATIDESSG